MSITLSDESTEKALGSLRRYFAEELEQDIGTLEARLFLEFLLEEIGPAVYNAAIADAQVYLRDRVADLDGACFAPEFGYWPKQAARRRPTS
jgi:uncharacterized protein (DUF2164 family)